MLIPEEDHIAHIGTLHKSGRYPWGSGEDPNQRNKTFLDYVSELHKQGMSDPDIARGMGMNTTELRAKKSIAKNEEKQADIRMAQRLKDKGLSNGKIGERMARDGVPRNESSIRALLAPGAADKADALQDTAKLLQDAVDKKGYIDIGTGVENHLDISKNRLSTAVAILKEKGYVVETVQVAQQGSATNKTGIKVLAPPGTVYRDIAANTGKIQQINEYSSDGGHTFNFIQPPISISSKRVKIIWDEDGGGANDGLIHVRPGAKDLSLGGSTYAQVRIAVDGTHYLKGMAVYKNDLPPGVDLQFHTNKTRLPDKLDVMKPMKLDEPDNPFGSVVRQLKQDPKDPERVTSAMNIVNAEGDWSKWSRNLSPQTLSKQSPTLAKSQLDMTYERKQTTLDGIMKLTNPAVRKKLLETYATEVDSSAVHLKAAALPRSSWHSILPMNTLKPNEIYAPNFRNGELVALIRYPHGGTFEIPELTVNNRNPQSKTLMDRAVDAVGIHSKVAERLSGADFDGDAVLVIPNERRLIKTTPALEGLKNFTPRDKYKEYPGMIPMSTQTKGTQMGLVSNLITDMTIRGANTTDIAKAIRHSMVVIDAEKHNLDYKASARDNSITLLKAKYQTPYTESGKAGASTLVSRAKSRADVPEKKLRKAIDGGPVDRETGKLVYVPTGRSYPVVKTTIDPETGQKVYTETGKTKPYTTVSKKLVETDNAFTLSSGTAIENVYAEHSNKLKNLANIARREAVNTKTVPYSPSARVAYANEVKSLNAKLNVALMNRPLERQAQVFAGVQVAAKRAANPTMDSASLKKVRFLALESARLRVGAKKTQVVIEPKEWDAIQAGAITNHKLTEILKNSDLKRVKELATPRVEIAMTSAKERRAQTMIASGYTRAEIADALGVSLSTLKLSLTPSEGG